MPRVVLLSLVALALSAGTALAQPRAYRGPHPMDLDGHWHLEDAVHVHHELAVGDAPFGEVDGLLVFLADPLAYGWDGDVWTFRGAHPLPGGVRGYCGMNGEHRHAFAPEGSFRREDDGVYVFTGAMHGGIDVVRPGRTAPRHPIVIADRPPPGVNTTPGVVPFWYAGCMHRLVMGRNGPVRVPIGGCTPRVIAPRRRGRTRAPDPPPPRPDYFDGNYTRYEGRRQTAPRPPASRSQRDERRRR